MCGCNKVKNLTPLPPAPEPEPVPASEPTAPVEPQE